VQLGAVGGEGRVWVGEPGEDGAEDSPALGGFAPTPADRQRFLQLVQQYRASRVQLSGAWLAWERWPAHRVRDHRAPQQPLQQWLLWLQLLR
jgi:hypothetical protein